jgi:hypothetical protein
LTKSQTAIDPRDGRRRIDCECRIDGAECVCIATKRHQHHAAIDKSIDELRVQCYGGVVADNGIV